MRPVSVTAALAHCAYSVNGRATRRASHARCSRGHRPHPTTDQGGGRSSLWGNARGLAASRVPSRSKTTLVFPARSTRPPVCFSVEAGASGRSLADREVNRVRRASTGASVNVAKNRDSAEREGNRSRSRPGHERDGKRLEPLVELFQRAFSADGVAKEHRQKIDHRIRGQNACVRSGPAHSSC